MIVEQALSLPLAPTQLWPWVSDPALLARWISDAQRFEARPAGPLAVGSTLLVHPPRGTPLEARVVRLEQQRELALHARGLPNDMEVALSFALAADSQGTRLVLRAETQLSGLMIFAEKMIASKAQAKLTQWTGKLRELVAAG